MPNVGSAARRMHVRWIKHYAIDTFVLIGELTGVNAIHEVCREYSIRTLWNTAPKNALAISYVSHSRATRDVERQDLREQVVVGSKERCEYK